MWYSSLGLEILLQPLSEAEASLQLEKKKKGHYFENIWNFDAIPRLILFSLA